MSFRTSEIEQFLADMQVPVAEVEQIKARAREAARDYPGRDGDEFAHSRLNFVLGRELAELFREGTAVPERIRRSA